MNIKVKFVLVNKIPKSGIIKLDYLREFKEGDITFYKTTSGEVLSMNKYLRYIRNNRIVKIPETFLFKSKSFWINSFGEIFMANTNNPWSDKFKVIKKFEVLCIVN